MNSLEFRRNWTDPPALSQGLLAQYLATWFTLCKNMPETGAARLTPQSRKGLMRAVAQIAQSVEQGIENPRVGGSIPSLGTNNSSLVQSVERRTVNPYVAGSSPAGGAKFERPAHLSGPFCIPPSRNVIP